MRSRRPLDMAHIAAELVECERKAHRVMYRVAHFLPIMPRVFVDALPISAN